MGRPVGEDSLGAVFVFIVVSVMVCLYLRILRNILEMVDDLVRQVVVI